MPKRQEPGAQAKWSPGMRCWVEVWRPLSCSRGSREASAVLAVAINKCVKEAGRFRASLTLLLDCLVPRGGVGGGKPFTSVANGVLKHRFQQLRRGSTEADLFFELISPDPVLRMWWG